MGFPDLFTQIAECCDRIPRQCICVQVICSLSPLHAATSESLFKYSLACRQPWTEDGEIPDAGILGLSTLKQMLPAWLWGNLAAYELLSSKSNAALSACTKAVNAATGTQKVCLSNSLCKVIVVAQVELTISKSYTPTLIAAASFLGNVGHACFPDLNVPSIYHIRHISHLQCTG